VLQVVLAANRPAVAAAFSTSATTPLIGFAPPEVAMRKSLVRSGSAESGMSGSLTSEDVLGGCKFMTTGQQSLFVTLARTKNAFRRFLIAFCYKLPIFNA